MRDQNRREYEITKNISLAQLHPLALIQLKQGGTCEFSLTEALFDLDYPGHHATDQFLPSQSRIIEGEPDGLRRATPELGSLLRLLNQTEMAR
jgi:Tc toxin complex TcA C-terminal TcB-binding domain